MQRKGWILEEVWDPEKKKWRDAWVEGEREKILSIGPHACHWGYDRFGNEATPGQPLPPLDNQYWVHIAPLHSWPPSPPVYASDCGTQGLQGLSCAEVHVPDLADLKSLRCLQLYHCCTKERALTQISSLINLRKLVIVETCLRDVPSSWSSLELLEELRLPNVQGLSSVLEHLPRLKKLNVDRGSRECTPLNLSFLSSLQILHLSSLQALPESIGSLSSLQELYVSACSSLRSLPKSLSLLSSLQILYLSNCDSLEALPESLPSLRELYLYECTSLEALPESLSSLQILRLYICSSLRTLPKSLDLLSSLRELDLDDCTSLEALPSLERLVSLEKLNITRCPALRDVSRGFASLEPAPSA